MTSLLLKDSTKSIVTLLQFTRNGFFYLSVNANQNWYMHSVCVIFCYSCRISKWLLISECNHCTSTCIDDLLYICT